MSAGRKAVRCSATLHVYEPRGVGRALETVGAWLLGILWVLPLLYAFWTAFHPAEFSTRFVAVGAADARQLHHAPGTRRRSRATSSTP